MQEITHEHHNVASAHHGDKKHDFTLEEAFGFGWDRTKKFWATMILIGVITMLVSFVFGAIGGYLGEMGGMGEFVSFFIVLASYAVSFWLSYNTVKMILKMTDGHKVDIKELFYFDDMSANKVGMYFLANLAYGLVVLVGLVLLIIPGIYFGVKYMFVPYLVLDKDMGIADAFKKSADMTDGKIWKLIGVSFLSFGIVIVGLIALLIGIIPAIILITFASTFIYRKLHAHQLAFYI